MQIFIFNCLKSNDKKTKEIASFFSGISKCLSKEDAIRGLKFKIHLLLFPQKNPF